MVGMQQNFNLSSVLSLSVLVLSVSNFGLNFSVLLIKINPLTLHTLIYICTSIKPTPSTYRQFKFPVVLTTNTTISADQCIAWETSCLGRCAMQTKADLKLKRDSIKRELLVLGEDIPANEFEKSNVLMQIVSRVCSNNITVLQNIIWFTGAHLSALLAVWSTD